jgi:hypothetical protein
MWKWVRKVEDTLIQGISGYLWALVSTPPQRLCFIRYKVRGVWTYVQACFWTHSFWIVYPTRQRTGNPYQKDTSLNPTCLIPLPTLSPTSPISSITPLDPRVISFAERSGSDLQVVGLHSTKTLISGYTIKVRPHLHRFPKSDRNGGS